MNYLPRVASNGNPPDLCLLSSRDYRQEHRCPALSGCFKEVFLDSFYKFNSDASWS
jgi:hypothetical protein